MVNEKSDNSSKLNYEICSNGFFSKKYNSKIRFNSYWHQIDEIISLNPANILEIGIGNGFVASYLRNIGFDLTTLDINKSLKPDYVESVLKLPFSDNYFDVILCCEVLEHLPYNCFLNALENIFRVSKKYSIVSIPDISRALIIRIELFRIKTFKKILPIGLTKKKIKKSNVSHHWEIGMKNYSLDRIKMEMEKVGFKVLKTYRVFENPYHRFFLLEKK